MGDTTRPAPDRGPTRARPRRGGRPGWVIAGLVVGLVAFAVVVAGVLAVAVGDRTTTDPASGTQQTSSARSKPGPTDWPGGSIGPLPLATAPPTGPPSIDPGTTPSPTK